MTDTVRERVLLEALTEIMNGLGIGPERIVACLATYDYSLLMATGFGPFWRNFPQACIWRSRVTPRPSTATN